MTRERVLMILGALVLISPWSGLPLAWLTWILPIIGLVVLAIGFTLRNRTAVAPPALPESREEPQPRSSHIAYS
jgi:Na+/H+ antiporter NhaC